MSKSTSTDKKNVERSSAQSPAGATAICEDAALAPAKIHVSLPAKTKFEKTQTMLTVISTSIGLMGVAGSIFAMGLATFYTGAVDVRTENDAADVVVKVYTKEGHESVYHTKHIELMPGTYHLEISSVEGGRVVHAETRIKFHKTNKLPVFLGKPVQAAAPTDATTGGAAAQQSAASNFMTGMLGAPATTGNSTTQQSTNVPAPQRQAASPAPLRIANNGTTSKTTVTTATTQASEAKNESDEDTQSSANSSGKKHRWWQFWKGRPTAENNEAGN